MVKEFALGQVSDTSMAAYHAYRARANNALNPSSAASDTLRSPFASGAEWQSAARERLAELDRNIAGETVKTQNADAAARLAEGKSSRAVNQRNMFDQEALQSATAREKAEMDIKQAKKIQEQSAPMRNAAEQESIDAMRTRVQREVIQSLPAMPSGPGLGAIGGSEVHETLKAIAGGIQELNQKWTA